MDDAAKRKPYGVVYAVICKVDGKMYIGATIKELSLRWTQHVSDSKHYAGCPGLAIAIRDLGRDEFTIEVLEGCSSQKALDRAERKWIAAYDTLEPNGYNRTAGGPGCEATDSVRADISSKNKALWADPEFRARAIAGMKSAKRFKGWTAEERSAAMGRNKSGANNPQFGKPGFRTGMKNSKESNVLRKQTWANKRSEQKA